MQPTLSDALLWLIKTNPALTPCCLLPRLFLPLPCWITPNLLLMTDCGGSCDEHVSSISSGGERGSLEQHLVLELLRPLPPPPLRSLISEPVPGRPVETRRVYKVTHLIMLHTRERRPPCSLSRPAWPAVPSRGYRVMMKSTNDIIGQWTAAASLWNSPPAALGSI